MRPALLRMAIRYLEDSDEAEDAVQDALLKLWFLRDRLDQYRSVEVIGTLPDLQQSILRMKHLEGFEVEEIARLTGSTPVAVRTNLSRARKRVKEQFMIHSKVWN